MPKAVFNLLGANFTDRYELANIIASQAHRLRADDTYVIARTTVASGSTTDKLTLDECICLLYSSIMGCQHFPNRE